MVCFLLSFNAAFSQQPAFFKLGEDQFRGVQIYDVIQDDELNYWFATNEGIYKYNFYSFVKVECIKAKSSSAFNFVKDEKGIIYCHNLNNQVFKIANNECVLFYELLDNESYSDVSLSIADDGNIVVAAKKIIVLKKSGEIQERHELGNHFCGQPFSTKEKKLQFHLNFCDSILEYTKGSFTLKKIHLSVNKDTEISVLKFFSFNNSSYALDLKSKTLFTYDPVFYKLQPLPKNLLFERSGSIRIYETGDEIWLAGTLPGALLLPDLKNRPVNNFYYEDYYISNVFKDNEGNIVLCTFDKGVLIIPDLNVPDVINSFRDDPITSLYSDETMGLILGSSKGNLSAFKNNSIQPVSANGDRPIGGVYGFPNSELIIYDDGQLIAFNKQTKQKTTLLIASLKGAVFVSEKEFYLGTNRGIYKVVWKGGVKFEVEPIKALNERIHFVEYNSSNHCLYTSTANGIFILRPNGKTQQVLYHGESIFPNDLFYSKGKIYATTKEDGILVIQDSKISSVIQPLIHGKEEILKKIIIHNNTIIARSTNGLFQFNMNGILMKSIHTMFGFSSQRVIDFTFVNSELWVSHSGGVQKINLNYYTLKGAKPTIQLNKVIVNNENHPFSQTHSFTSNQRKFQFIFSSPTLKNRETIRYYYKLVGYDKTWNINDPNSNQITYNALSSGKYTFQVKAENQGVFSELKSYYFEIAAPIYARWWFIALLVLLFLGIVYAIYMNQLKIQRKKSDQINELNASKLTAIQSQMNPHFIFNSLNSIQDLILKGDVEHSYS
ncbi:MAG: hypothetical protein RI883_2529, partial [Bacteroidota bacterium]